MGVLIIKPTKTTPYVCFDPLSSLYEISGNFFSGDPSKIFDLIFEWLNKNMSCLTGKIKFKIKLNYFNSSSIRLMLKMLKILEEHFRAGQDIEIEWYLNDDDVDNEGIMLSQILEIPFEFKNKNT